MQPIPRHAIAAALVALCCAGTLAATDLHDLRGTTAIHGNATAGHDKAAVCSACHGADGHSVVPQFPNLAGQSPTYLYVQMLAYRDGWRDNAVMQAQLAPMDDEDLRNLAAYFAAMATRQGSGAGDASRGSALYSDGDPARGIPACQGCHGSDGRGPHPYATSRMPGAAWATFPALAGQPAEYLAAQLKAYRDGSRGGSSNTAVMHGVVQGLGDDDIEALAGYIAGM